MGRRSIRSPARRRPGRARRRSRLLEAALGLEFDAARGEIRLRNPRLPAFLNEVVLRDLHLGPSSVDLWVRRHGDDVSLEVLRTRGQIQVSIVLRSERGALSALRRRLRRLESNFGQPICDSMPSVRLKFWIELPSTSANFHDQSRRRCSRN